MSAPPLPLRSALQCNLLLFAATALDLEVLEGRSEDFLIVSIPAIEPNTCLHRPLLKCLFPEDRTLVCVGHNCMLSI